MIATLRTRRIPRPSAALVVAFAALFTALGGTGYAAIKITGANVANGTLTGADVQNRSLGAKEHKLDSIGGAQVKEASLGTVPNAQLAAKASDADTLGGSAPSSFMTQKARALEANLTAVTDLSDGAVVGSLSDLQPGTYVVTAKLTYDNDGASQQESCALHVPGTDDVTSFTPSAGGTETITLQEATSSNAVFSPSVTCSSDGNDDTEGTGSIIAVRLD